jgi:hypothetical protein
MPAPSTEPLLRLAADTRKATQIARWQIAAACLALVVLAAILVARRGTTATRLGAALAMTGTAVAIAGLELAHRRRYTDVRRFLAGPVRRADAARADKVARALTLLGEPATSGLTSLELANLHVERAIAQLPARELTERASRAAALLSRAALVLVAIGLGVAIAYAFALIEGVDVMVARGGVAPLPMTWLDGLDVSARPPEYLHQSEIHQLAFQSIVLPSGTSITMRGTPTHSGRRLLLSDGSQEIPFVDDGSGAVVARWSLTQSRTLRVVARFGDVVIPAPDSLEVQSIDDEPPVVRLEGAPREVKLIEADSDIPIRFEAEDDHGLREVQLVLRSGTREDRRQLAHLDDETRVFRSGSVLRLRDAFLKKSHVPVSVTVEAKDNDPLTGPKWGASEVITVVPPDVGEPEALRLAALRALRDTLVDTLAVRLDREENGGWPAVAAEDLQQQNDDDRATTTALSYLYGGLRVPTRVAAVLAAGQQTTRRAVDAEVRRPSAATHNAVVHATEHFVLVVDAVVRGLGQRDTRTSAAALADVADDLANSLGSAPGGAAGAVAKVAAREEADTRVLEAGGAALRRLGFDGRDLGEIVDADLARISRARKQGDVVHAELATRDLAARLHQPDPSFGARGGNARGGDEAGGAKDAEGEESQPDDVEEAFNEAAQELEHLAQDHAGEIAKLEQALAGALDDEEVKKLREEAKRHADVVREAAQSLPRVGMGSDSWTAKGAGARELAEQMARSLEEGRAGDAAQSGRSATGSIDEAKRVLQHSGWFEDPDGERLRRLEETRRKLEAETRWAEDQAAEMRRRASARAREQLQRGGEEESQLAERAGEIGRKARERGALPEQALDGLEEAERAAEQAAQAFKEGGGDRGLEHQREAQRRLEAVQQQLRGDEDESPGAGPDGNGREPSREPVAIPGASEHKGPEEFRRRVMRGLGERSNGALRDAVQRYAEGLLR